MNMNMKMTLQEQKKYKLKFNFNGINLTYTAKIIELDNNFISFIDKFGNTYNYNIVNLESFEKVENNGGDNYVYN